MGAYLGYSCGVFDLREVDHGAFMRIHEKRGFKVTGSYAWIRTEDGLKWMK